MIYIVLYILLVIEGVICRKLKNGKKLFLVMSYLQLTLLLGLRGYDVGVDTKSYIDYFKLVSAGISGWMEPGITIIIRLIVFLGGEKQILFLIFSIITMAGFYYFIINMSEDIYLSVLLLYSLNFYFFSFNAMRQAMAIALISIAFVKVDREQYFKAVLWMIIGCMFHSSSIIAIIIILLKKFKVSYKRNYVYVVGLGSIFLMLIAQNIVNIASKIYTRYAVYIGSSFDKSGNFINPLLYLIIFICCSYYYERLNSVKNDFLIILLAIGVFLYFISIKVQIVNRLVYYFTISALVLIPRVINTFSQKIKLQWRWVVILFAGIYTVLLIYRNAQGIVPYRFFWNE